MALKQLSILPLSTNKVALLFETSAGTSLSFCPTSLTISTSPTCTSPQLLGDNVDKNKSIPALHIAGPHSMLESKGSLEFVLLQSSLLLPSASLYLGTTPLASAGDTTLQVITNADETSRTYEQSLSNASIYQDALNGIHVGYIDSINGWRWITLNGFQAESDIMTLLYPNPANMNASLLSFSSKSYLLYRGISLNSSIESGLQIASCTTADCFSKKGWIPNAVAVTPIQGVPAQLNTPLSVQRITCSPGSYLEKGACKPVPPGYFLAPDASVAQPCDMGSFSSGPGNSKCISCPPGTFSADKALDACTPCPLNTYSAFQGSTQCQICPDLLDNQTQPGMSSCTH